MQFEIKPQSNTPIYQQLRDQIILGIATGELAVGELLPSVRQLAEEIGINTMTISKAYNSLKEDGLLITDRRKGTAVAAPRKVFLVCFIINLLHDAIDPAKTKRFFKCLVSLYRLRTASFSDQKPNPFT